MLKIISKKKYERKIQLIEQYEEKIESKDLKIYLLEMDNENKKGLIDKLTERIKLLEQKLKSDVNEN